jgi:hypothetical protein
MAEFKISRIKFTWLGDWAPSFNYVKDDIVRYGAKSYACLHGHTSSPNFYTDLEKQDTTTVPITADPQWQLMFDGYEWQGDWTPLTFYNNGDLVKYRGIVYICVNRHTSLNSTSGLEGSIVNWAPYARTEEWTGDWAPNTKYSVNDIVKWGGIVYRCISNHNSASLISGLEGNQGAWEVVVPSEQWQGNWAVSTKYKVNDIVKYGGIVYRCSMAHTSAATIAIGLESDLDLLDSTMSKWEIVQEGIEYLGDWVPEITGITPSPGYRYKLNDVVKYGAGIWICSEGHTSDDTFDLTKWIIYVPGLEYDNTWNSITIYQQGDVVKYGGYSYYALRNNVNSIPSTALGDSTLDNWELLTKGFKIQGEWTTATAYRVGDVLRRSGQLYVAVNDTTTDPNDDSVNWELVIPGEKWQTRWQSGSNYVIGDMLTFQSNTYRCLVKHTSNLATRPDVDASGLWTLVNEGDEFNSLREQGDLKFYGVTEDGSSIGNTNLPIGIDGQALQATTSNEIDWTSFQLIEKVYYVSLDGVDQPNYGTTINAPWRTVKYACDSITGPATIFIKVGVYSEELPIKVPRDVALVGEELRSTIIEPAQGYTLSNMFYVNNGTGIRNMTLRGLNGTLGPFNQYLTQRPTAGAYVSLDPGLGPSDTSVWITNKSCYVQNVTTFGNGCTGLKIDGAIHNGGNRSIVANDFTQVLSDGIGVWCTNKGLTELVSVFSYYGHIGYLAENGGKIRATNGNSSYGTYGCVAEGVAEDELPISGVINNQTQEAQIRAAFSGEANDEILKLEFSNAGQNYTSVNYAFSGSGVNAQVIGDEFRDNAIFEARILDPVDSTGSIGGGGYISTGNNAQAGDPWSVTIATGDTNDITTYYGCRIILQSGTGTGQYGKVVAYDTTSKIINVASEHFQTITSTATSVTNNLISADTTSLYVGMPVYLSYETINVVITATSVGTNRVTLTSNAGLVVGMPIEFEGPIGVISGATVYYVQSIIPGGTQITISTTNGGGVYALTNATATINGVAGGMLGGLIHGQLYYVIAANFSSTQFAVSTLPGGSAETLTTQIGLMYIDRAGWSHVNAGTPNIALLDTTSVYRIEPRPTFSLPPYAESGLSVAGGGLTWTDAAYGANNWVLLSQSGTLLTYNGSIFSTVTLPIPTGGVYSAVCYGNDKFVAIATNVDNVSGPAVTAYSATGASWTGGTLPGTTSNWADITYGGGKFVAISATSGTTAAYSLDGITWLSAALPTSGIWASVAYGGGKFVAIRTTSSVAAYSSDGIAWATSTLPASATWSSVTFGNGRFVAVASGGTRVAISFNGIDWSGADTQLPVSSTWTKVAYGQGKFLAISSSTTSTVAFSDDGYYWEAKAVSGNVGRSALAFGNPNNIGRWITLPTNGNSANSITYGSAARGRVEVNGGRISLVKLWDSGSGYTGAEPTLTLTDPNITSAANFECRTANGVLGNPTFINRGIGYKTSTTTVTVSGDGFANILPVGQNLILDNVTRLPRTGANLTLDLISWETSNMPSSNLWSSVTYGDKFVAVAGVSGSPTTSAAYSSNGASWSSSTLPASAAWCGVAYGNGKYVAISTLSTEAVYSTNGITWSSAALPAARSWKTVIFGSGVFVAIASGTNKAAYSLDGQTWIESNMPATADWTGITTGNGLFMAVASGGTVAATSNNGIDWNGKALPSSDAWSLMSFYAGQFIAVATGSDKLAYTTDDGTSWNEITLPVSATWSALTHANGKYLLASNVGDFITSTDGLIWKIRPIELTAVKSIASGANVFVAVGTGPLAVVAPDGSTDIVYRVLTISLISGTPPSARVAIRVSPTFTRTNAPINGVDVIIREKYSQVRLTGHDFLEIGTGNFVDTNYPSTAVNNFQPDKEVYYRGGGRVFYTSTDQDGNFRVGELFAVEQATGVITISADYFDLSGLSEIRLGGIRVGGTGVVIREFSTDATFTADSNNIVPTQKAIKAYIGRRISGGGSDAATGRLIAGTVSIGPDSIGNTTGIRNQITVPMVFKKGQGGYMTAWSMFADSFNSQLDWQEIGRDLG